MTLNIATATTSLIKAKISLYRCRWAKKINPDNAIYFSSREEAFSYGMYLAKYVNHKILNLINKLIKMVSFSKLSLFIFY